MTDSRKHIFGLQRTELESLLLEEGIERYRAQQLAFWLYKKPVDSFDRMTTLSKDLRELLNQRFILRYPEIVKISESDDGTRKFLLRMEENISVEAVLIPAEFAHDSGEPSRLTLCISTQAGCPLDCRFCATGSMQFRRNLTAGEIVGQYFAIQASQTTRITNIVYMGMGEPLLNYDEVMKSIDIITSPDTDGMGANRITVSTAGIVPAIHRMAEEHRTVKLAISLHAGTDGTRSMLMPITKKYPLRELLDAAERYYRETRKPITYEYILFNGLNDSLEDAGRLAKISRRVPSKVNIIPFHSIDAAYPEGAPLGLQPSTPQRMEEFAAALRSAGTTVMFRSSSGKDINAACGQLALRNAEKKIA